MGTYYHSNYSTSSRRSRKKKSKIYKFIRSLFILLLLIASTLSYMIYQALYKENTWTDNHSISIYIKTGDTFEDVKNELYRHGLIIHRKNFEWVANQKKYPEKVKPGHYTIKKGMNNNVLVNMLRAGLQTPVDVIFNNIRTIPQLCGVVSEQLSFDSTTMMQLLSDTVFLAEQGFTKSTVKSMFIPNTYEFYWTTTPQKFFTRMKEEYNRFWTEARLTQAEKIGLSPQEVITLASIVEKETAKNDEKPKVAGVYMNRLNSGWRLQADPTLIYALNDFAIKRVLNEHKKIDSPYNTYKYGGLPPGPICIPSIASVKAVLNYEEHKYMYFCARDDFSGYHAFARTNVQHTINANKYRRALNKRKIYK